MTNMLWVSEGFTVYYEYLMLARSGRMAEEELLEALRKNIVAYENNTGRPFQSATQSSYDTWNQGPFGRGKGAGVPRTISYYRRADANPGGRILPTEADMSLLNVATCFGVAATLAALMAPVLVLAAQGQASPCPDQAGSTSSRGTVGFR